MRFQRVVFRCFGPFSEQTLDLSAADGLHVLYGPNEAGKSAALRGLRAFLFGFPGQSGDDFLFKYNQFRVHAVVTNAAGRTLECIRRKGNKDTLRSPDDKLPIPERQLMDYLGGLDEAQFEQLFGLDANQLVEGGQTIAEGQGQLGEALFAAGAGMKGLRVLSQDLEKRQLALYKVGGKNQPLPETLRRYHDLRDEVRSRVLPAEKFAAAESDTLAAHDCVQKLNAERKMLRTRLDELKRYQAALPTIDLLHAARQRLQPVADAPLLTADFDGKLEDARKKLTVAQSQLTDQERQRQELARQIEHEHPSGAILAEEDEIEELKKLIGADKKLREEAVKAVTFSIDEKGKARDIFRELTGTTDWEQMDRLKPRLDERQRINELANKYEAVVENDERQDKAVQEATVLLVDARKKLVEAPVPEDSSPWQTVVEQIVALGPLEDEVYDRMTSNQAEESSLAAEFTSFNPAIPGRWQESPGLPIPLAEVVERFRRECDDANRAAAKVSGEIERNTREIEEVKDVLVDRVGSESIPTVEDLEKGRRDRDGGLHCIRRRLDGHGDEQSERAFIGRHAPDQSLMDAAEKAVRQCDTLADRLRREADRVAASVSLNEKLHRLQEHRLELDGQVRVAGETRTAVDQRWQSAWQPSSIPSLDPGIMQSWLSKWTKFCERVTRWRNACQKCHADHERINLLRDQLTAACPPAKAAKTLSDALALAKTAIAKAISARAIADKRGEEASRLQAALEKAEQAAEQAKKRREEWASQWSKAVAVLCLSEAAPSVKTAQDYLSRIERMQQHLRDMRIKDARVREIEKDNGLLIDRVNRLRQRLAPESRRTTSETLDTDYRALEIELRDARDQRTRRAEATKSLKKIENELSNTTDRLKDAEAALVALATEAGVEVDCIPQAVQRARERAEAAPHVRKNEDALTKSAGGVPLAIFIEAAQQHRDGLDHQIDDLGRRAEQLDFEISKAEAASNEADRVLHGYSQASDEAANARQRAELLAQRLEEYVVEYAALHLARTVLEKAKERYRAQHQDTLLDRAGNYFCMLTNGAFSGIEIDNDDGLDVLEALRAGPGRPDARVSVTGLSDGTRDQLFLALRLAGIERHLQDREPVPLIIDDVLVNFDDHRTCATLRCLAELAKKTQVLLFTHHGHVVKSAQAVHPATSIHELASCP